MADHRPFPPSPRRRALALRAGLHAASPGLVGAAAAIAVLVAAVAIGGAAAHRLGAAVAAACSGRAVLTPAALPRTVTALALPILGAAAVAALLAQLAQTRAAWLPRRRIDGSPELEAGAGPRTRRAAGELAAAAAIGGAAFGWLWWAAPRIAALLELPARPALDPAVLPPVPPPALPPVLPPAGVLSGAPSLLAGAVALIASLGAALAATWVVLGALDALARHAALAHALRMTAADKRQDDRLAGADPRWRARRDAISRGPRVSEAVAAASVVLTGDDTAVAVAWDPAHRPVPLRVATGRGARATQLVGLARRHRIAVHRDPRLVGALIDGEGPVPDAHWPRLAEIIAAIRGRDRDQVAGNPL